MNSPYSEKEQFAQTYYDSLEINLIYIMIWGGEDIHFGIYTGTNETIPEAAQRTVAMMAHALRNIRQESRVIDLGAGYGGAARYLAKNYGCSVCCLNISTLQNQLNQQLTQAQNMSHLIEVKEGSFENIPYPDHSFDIVWSQDAIIHSDNRRQVLEEIRRVLKQGGELIFTDILQNDNHLDNALPDGLQEAFKQLQISNAGSFPFYRHTLQELGFKELKAIDLSEHVNTHYIRFREEILKHSEEIIEQTSKKFIDHFLERIESWRMFYQKSYIQWGFFHYYLP